MTNVERHHRVDWEDLGALLRPYSKVRRRPVGERQPDPVIQFIRQVAAGNPGLTPDEVYAEIHHGRGRRDITRDVVRAVLG